MRTLEERISGPEAEPWKPEEGDLVIGELEEISEREGDYGPYRVITLFTDSGDVWNVAGFGTVLAGKFASLSDSDLGCRVAVKYIGEATGKSGKSYKNWSVSIDRSVTPVTGGEFAE